MGNLAAVKIYIVFTVVVLRLDWKEAWSRRAEQVNADDHHDKLLPRVSVAADNLVVYIARLRCALYQCVIVAGG